MKAKKIRQINRKQAIFGLMVAAVVFFVFQAITTGDSRKIVKFKLTDGSYSQPFKVEIAESEAERQKGLMYRKHLSDDEGMLFIFPGEDEDRIFWMKNTYISLDMIFIDSNKKVVGILEEVPILNDVPRKVEKPSKYVVELAAGVAGKNRIQEGAVMEY